MEGREKGMRERLECLVPNRRQMHQADAAVGIGRASLAVSAIDDDVMPIRGQPRAEFLGKRLEATISAWNPARSEDRQPQLSKLTGCGLAHA